MAPSTQILGVTDNPQVFVSCAEVVDQDKTTQNLHSDPIVHGFQNILTKKKTV